MVEQIHEKGAARVPQNALWQWRELREVLAQAGLLSACDESEVSLTGVNVDSRLISAGQLFLALPGDPGDRFPTASRSQADGHDYVQSAFDRGAAGAIVARPIEATGATMQVTDTYDALWALGRAAAQRLPGAKIAVTGSSGKTTAKTMLQQVFGGYASPGSFNNHIGVPLSLLNAPLSDKPAVFEIGTSSPGEIEPLASMVAPSVAVVLNVGVAHAENFPDHAALRKEKLSIFNSLQDKSNSVWEYSLGLDQGLSFGSAPAADVSLRSLEGDRAEILVCGERVSARVPGGGEHRAWTLCAVLACCRLLDVPLSSALELGGEVVPGGRGNVLQAGGRVIIDDSYNANPDSMQHALDAFVARPEVHKVYVIGEMLELGEPGPEAHATIAARLAGQTAVLVGESFAEPARAHGLEWFERADEALLKRVEALCPTGSAVIVKGSNRVFWQHDFVARLNQRFS